MREVTWGSIASLVYGKALTGYSREKSAGPTQVFGTNGPIGTTDLPMHPGGRVIVGRKGAYRGVHLARGPFWVIDTAYYLDHGPDIDPRWAYYSLLNTDINGLGSGSAIPSTSREDFYALKVQLPNLQEQRAIAEVLGALDDKIAANTKLVATCDELSRLRFESLLCGPDTRPLSGLARFVNGKAFTKGATGTGRVVIRIAELNSGIGGSTVYNDIEVPDEFVAHPGDLLFAWSGSLTVQRWFRPDGIVNQHIFKVIPTTVPMWVVKGALDRKLAEFRGIAADKATTMGHIQRHHLDELVEIPAATVIHRHDQEMTALWDRALSAEVETLQLAETRDALLPLLMSGKLRVKDAERVVEEAV